MIEDKVTGAEGGARFARATHRLPADCRRSPGIRGRYQRRGRYGRDEAPHDVLGPLLGLGRVAQALGVLRSHDHGHLAALLDANDHMRPAREFEREHGDHDPATRPSLNLRTPRRNEAPRPRLPREILIGRGSRQSLRVCHAPCSPLPRWPCQLPRGLGAGLRLPLPKPGGGGKGNQRPGSSTRTPICSATRIPVCVRFAPLAPVLRTAWLQIPRPAPKLAGLVRYPRQPGVFAPRKPSRKAPFFVAFRPLCPHARVRVYVMYNIEQCNRSQSGREIPFWRLCFPCLKLSEA